MTSPQRDDPWLEVYDATRIGPEQGINGVISENINVLKHFLGGRQLRPWSSDGCRRSRPVVCHGAGRVHHGRHLARPWRPSAVSRRSVLGGALVLLPVVAVIGFLMFMTWLAGRRAVGAATAPEQRFPTAIVAAHGVFAVLTLVAVLAALMA